MQISFSPTKSLKNRQLKKCQVHPRAYLNSSNPLHKIKNQIQQVLKRHSNPFPLITSNPIKKQQKLQPKQLIYQNIPKANQNQSLSIKKQYYDSLFTNILSQNKQSLEPYNLGSQDKKLKQTIFCQKNKSQHQIIFERQFSMSKNDFYTQHLTEKHLLKNNQQKKLGLGRILFKKDKNIKLRRQDLLSTISNYSQNNNILRKIDHPSLTHQQFLVDINKYIASVNSSILEHNRSLTKLNISKQIQTQRQLKNQKSLQIFKKTITAKQTNLPINPQDLKIVGSFKQHHIRRQNQTNLPIIVIQQQPIINFKDSQLLVYYGKVKKKSLQNKHNHKHHRLNFISKHQLPEMPELITKQNFRKASKNNSIELKRQEWKMDRFDPWERTKVEDYQHEHEFLSYQSQPEEQTNSLDRSTINSTII